MLQLTNKMQKISKYSIICFSPYQMIVHFFNKFKDIIAKLFN